jgi:hypothetical protein
MMKKNEYNLDYDFSSPAAGCYWCLMLSWSYSLNNSVAYICNDEDKQGG